MKTIAKSLLLGLSIFGAFVGVLVLTAQAVNARPINHNKTATVRHAAYIANNNQTVNVMIEKQAGRSVKVAFLNNAGEVLAFRHLAKEDVGAFKVGFNVANLADGEYSVRILGKSVAADYTIKLETPKTEPVREISLR